MLPRDSVKISRQSLLQDAEAGAHCARPDARKYGLRRGVLREIAESRRRHQIAPVRKVLAHGGKPTDNQAAWPLPLAVEQLEAVGDDDCEWPRLSARLPQHVAHLGAGDGTQLERPEVTRPILETGDRNLVDAVELQQALTLRGERNQLCLCRHGRVVAAVEPDAQAPQGFEGAGVGSEVSCTESGWHWRAHSGKSLDAHFDQAFLIGSIEAADVYAAPAISGVDGHRVEPLWVEVQLYLLARIENRCHDAFQDIVTECIRAQGFDEEDCLQAVFGKPPELVGAYFGPS